VVPVGKDQRQHLELTIDWAGKFNRHYSKGYDTHARAGGLLKIPAARIRDETASVPGRDGQKMSKTYDNTIDLFGTDKEVEKQVKSVKTDSTPPNSPKPLVDQPLYELLKLVLPPQEFEVVDARWREGGDPKTHGYGAFKQTLLDGYHAAFDEARARYTALMADRGELDRLLSAGAVKARKYAAPVMDGIRAAVGL
jgi:tryptophanyl-tRNA synthetase